MQHCKQFMIAHVMLIAAALVMEGRPPSIFAQDSIPEVDDLLRMALEHHPEVVAARAKVAVAEAALDSCRFEVSRQIVDLRMRWGQVVLQMESQNRLREMRPEGTSGSTGSPEESEAAKRESLRRRSEITAIMAKLDEERVKLEMEMRLYMGGATAQTRAEASAPTSQRVQPSGPVVQRVMEALDNVAPIEFRQTPFAEVAQKLSDKFEIPILIQDAALDSMGIALDHPVTLVLDNVPLRSILEALEDLLDEEVRFVVRDYGLLVTTKFLAEERSYVEAASFRTGTGGSE